MLTPFYTVDRVFFSGGQAIVFKVAFSGKATHLYNETRRDGFRVASFISSLSIAGILFLDL